MRYIWVCIFHSTPIDRGHGGVSSPLMSLIRRQEQTARQAWPRWQLPVSICAFEEDGVDDWLQKLLQSLPLVLISAWGVGQQGAHRPLHATISSFQHVS